MKKKHLTQVIALLSVDVASYPLAATMTSAELVDYYAKAIQYDAVVSRNVDVHETRYEVKDIEGAKSEKLKDLASQCEAILGMSEYTPTEESLKLVSNDTFNYVKGVIDNEVLSDGKHLQKAKELDLGSGESATIIARAAILRMEKDWVYIIGPGGTTWKIKELLSTKITKK